MWRRNQHKSYCSGDKNQYQSTLCSHAHKPMQIETQKDTVQNDLNYSPGQMLHASDT